MHDLSIKNKKIMQFKLFNTFKDINTHSLAILSSSRSNFIYIYARPVDIS